MLEGIRFGQLRQGGALLAASEVMERGVCRPIEKYRARQGVVDGLTRFLGDMLLRRGRYPEFTSAPAWLVSMFGWGKYL
jgi:hypothetical protein